MEMLYVITLISVIWIDHGLFDQSLLLEAGKINGLRILMELENL